MRRTADLEMWFGDRISGFLARTSAVMHALWEARDLSGRVWWIEMIRPSRVEPRRLENRDFDPKCVCFSS